jgi:signal transduction histidine kinase
MKKFSLARLLIATVVGSHLLLATGLIVVGMSFSSYYLHSAFDNSLKASALNVAAHAYLSDDGVQELKLDAAKIPRSSHHHHPDIYWVHSGNEKSIASTDGSRIAVFRTIPPNVMYWNLDILGEPYRAIVLHGLKMPDATGPSQPPDLTVIYAAPTMDIPRRIGALDSFIAITSVLLTIPTIILAVWCIRRTLDPLRDLAKQAQKISVRNWEFRPSDRARAAIELEPLITALETALSSLQHAFKRQREFLGDAAHELKTSVAIIKSTLQSLLNRPRTIEEYRDALLKMDEDSDRLEDLLSRMLRLARVEQWAADGIRRDLDPTDIATTCEMSIARISELAAARNIEVSFTADGNGEMQADPADLELVWTNLLENALRYSPAGSRVVVTLQVEEQTAAIAVRDTGNGIPESELELVFDRFRRGDQSRTRATGGFGLGLAIVKSVVEAYGGTVRATSKLGEGTCITTRLQVRPTPYIPDRLVSSPKIPSTRP